MATYILTVNAVERELRLGTLNLQSVINGRDTMTCQIVSLAAAYRPTLGHEVIVTENGNKIFGGLIESTEETKPDANAYHADIATEIQCVAFNVYADRRFITEAWPAGTDIADIATDIVTNYLADYGVTLDAGQASGTTIAEDLTFDAEQLSAALDKITTLTGWPWKINPDKEFSIFNPGSVASPVDVVDGDGHHVGDIRVRRSRAQQANRIIVKAGDSKVVEKVDSFTGDGTTTTFPLTYQMVYQPVVGRGYVVENGVFKTLGLTTATWIYDPATNSLIYTPALDDTPTAFGNGETVQITYDAQFPFTVTVEDASDIGLNGLYEKVIVLRDVYDRTMAESLALALLAAALTVTEEVEFDTYELGMEPGQTLTVTAADRNVNGTFMITEVAARNANTEQDVRRTVKAIDGTTFRGSFRDVYKMWAERGSSQTLAGTGPASTTGGSGVGGVNRHVQFNNYGVFGGNDGLVFDHDGSGITTIGVEGLPTMLAVSSNNESKQQLAIYNRSAGVAKALTLWQLNNGEMYIEQDDGELNILTYGSNSINLEAANGLLLSGGSASTDETVRLKPLIGLDSLYLTVVRKTGNYTYDSARSGGGVADSVVIFNGSSNATLTLPALSGASGLIHGIHSRVVTLINESVSAKLTVDGNSSEVIGYGSGAATYDLMPGESIVLVGWSGTAPGWKILSSHKAVSPGTLALGTGAVTGRGVSIGRNSSGGGAAGHLELVDKGGTSYFVWVDDTGVLRIHTAAPTEDNTTVSDVAGTVVGSQT